MTKSLYAILVAALLSTACAGGPDFDRSSSRFDPETSADGWLVRVSVDRRAVGPLTISLGEVQRTGKESLSSWLRHEITFENGGGVPLRFEVTRNSSFASGPGGPRLLVADSGCGFEPRGPKLVNPGVCISSLVMFRIPPGGSIDQTIHVYKDLGGKEELQEGTYAFVKEVRFKMAGREHTGKVRLICEIHPAVGI